MKNEHDLENFLRVTAMFYQEMVFENGVIMGLHIHISKKFPGLRPVPRWGGLQRPPQTPQLIRKYGFAVFITRGATIRRGAKL